MLQTRVLYQPRHSKHAFYRYGWTFTSPDRVQQARTRQKIEAITGYRFLFDEVLPGDIDYQKKEKTC